MGLIENAKAGGGKQRAIKIRGAERASGRGTRPTHVLRVDAPKSQGWNLRARAHMGAPVLGHQLPCRDDDFSRLRNTSFGTEDSMGTRAHSICPNAAVTCTTTTTTTTTITTTTKRYYAAFRKEVIL